MKIRQHGWLILAVGVLGCFAGTGLSAEGVKAPDKSGFPSLKLSFVSGDVTLVSGDKSVPAKKNMTLSVSDHMILGSDESMVELRASDETLFRMARPGELVFQDAGKDKGSLHLSSGRLYIRRSASGKVNWTLTTPQAFISQPGEGTIMITETGTRVAVFDGTARVASASGKNAVTVKRSHETEVAPGGMPAEPSKSRMRLFWYKKGFPE
jgi:hypothetical protein